MRSAPLEIQERKIHENTQWRWCRILGSHLCDRLLNEGHEVICLDNYFTQKEKHSAPSEHTGLRDHPA
jgi:hypothetical protein